MSNEKRDFKSLIAETERRRQLQLPREGIIGSDPAVEHSDEPLDLHLSVVPEGVRIQANRPVKDFALQPDHATNLGLALIQNAVVSRLRQSVAAEKAAQKPS